MTRYGPETLKCYLPLNWLHCALFVLFSFSENPWEPSNPKLRQFRPLGETLTSFCFSVVKVCTEKFVICHIINNVDEKDV